MKIASLAAGILALSTVACVIAVLCGFPAPLEIGAAFVISSTTACSIGLLRGGSRLFAKMSRRELFVLEERALIKQLEAKEKKANQTPDPMPLKDEEPNQPSGPTSGLMPGCGSS